MDAALRVLDAALTEADWQGALVAARFDVLRSDGQLGAVR